MSPKRTSLEYFRTLNSPAGVLSAQEFSAPVSRKTKVGKLTRRPRNAQASLRRLTRLTWEPVLRALQSLSK